jgi:hypothetical protein
VECAFPTGALSDEAAGRLLDEARALLGGSVDADEIRVHGLRAKWLLRQGRVDEARAVAAEAATWIARSSPTAFYSFEGRTGAAEACLGLWERSPDPALRAMARQTCRALARFARVFPIGAPRALLCRGVYQWLAGRRSAARRSWRASLREAQRLGMPYEEALAHAELGRRLGDVAHRGAAEALFERLGAAWELTRLREGGR